MAGLYFSEFTGICVALIYRKNIVSWRCRSVCYGTAELSNAGNAQCSAVTMGKSKKILYREHLLLF